MSQRVASRTDVIPIALGDEEPDGQARQSVSEPGFGAAPTAPELRRNQRQLLITPIFVIVEVGDLLRFKLNQSRPTLDRQSLSMFLRDHEPTLFIHFFAK